jgi:hypothetical protein
MKVFFKIIAYLIVLLLISVSTAVGYAIYYLEKNNGKLPSQVISQIENSLNNISPDFDVFVGSAEAQWQGFDKSLLLTLKNSYIRRGEETISSAPLVHAGINLRGLLKGRVIFEHISITSPEFLITNKISDKNGHSEEIDILNFYQNILINFVQAIKVEGNTFPIEKLEMKDSTLRIANAERSFRWQVKYADLRFYELQNSFYLKSKVESIILGKQASIENEIRLTRNELINFKTSFMNFPSRILAGFQPDLSWLDKFNSFTSGDADIIFDSDGKLNSMQVKSIIEFEDKNFLNSLIDFHATYITAVHNENAKPQIKGGISVKDIPMNNLARIWPEAYGGGVRKDVIDNYSDGIYKSVEIEFDFIAASEDFKEILQSKFNIIGDISDATIIFHENYPKLNNVNGSFSYDGNNLDLAVQTAKMGNSVFENSKIKILDLAKDKGTILEIEGDVSGGLSDLKPLLSAIFEGKDKNYFYNKYKIDSVAKTKFYYRDDITAPFETELVKLDISSEITDVKIDNIFKGLDLTSENLNFIITEKGIELSGHGEVNGSPANVDFKYSFDDDEFYELNLVAEIPEKIIYDAAPDLKDYISGSVTLDLVITHKNKSDYVTGKIDLTNSNINIAIFSWKKAVGEFGDISFFGELKENELIINDFQIVDKNSVSSGNAKFNFMGDGSESINFTNMNFGRNNANVVLKRESRTLTKAAMGKKNIATASNYVINIVGSAFDLENYIKDTGYSEQPFGLDLRLRVDKAYMANGIVLTSANANLECVFEFCTFARATGKFESGSITVEYKPKTENIYGVRNFILTTDNAAATLKGLDVSSNIKNGNLNIISVVNERGGQETEGIISLNDFKLTGTPILAKIVSLASLTGIIDLLEGEGLSFKKMKGSIQMIDHLISVKDFKALGGSIGITAAGMIDLKAGTIDISGAVTPAYTVNSIVGKIPLLGKVFTGKDGEGIIATKYSVKGKYADPDVGVNPLSLITPGFLRNIWSDSETDILKELENNKAQSSPKKEGSSIAPKRKRR